MRLKTVFEPSDEGGYTVHVLGLPGCLSEGDTLNEARVNIREAISLWIQADFADVPDLIVVEELR